MLTRPLADHTCGSGEPGHFHAPPGFTTPEDSAEIAPIGQKIDDARGGPSILGPLPGLPFAICSKLWLCAGGSGTSCSMPVRRCRWRWGSPPPAKAMPATIARGADTKRGGDGQAMGRARGLRAGVSANYDSVYYRSPLRTTSCKIRELSPRGEKNEVREIDGA
jgi:hypothetical protein